MLLRTSDVLVAETGVDRIDAGTGNDILLDGALLLIGDEEGAPATPEDEALDLFLLPTDLRDLGYRYFPFFEVEWTGEAAADDGDSKQDTFSGGSGDDQFYVDSAQAAKDIVSCGAGNDTVRADSADEVASDCENVTRR